MDNLRIQHLDNGSLDLLSNGSLENWTSPPDPHPVDWRSFAVNGAASTLEQIGSVPSKVQDWSLYGF